MEILETSELNLELSEEGIGKEGHGSKEIERNVWSGVERVPPAHSGYKNEVIQIQIKSHTNTNANTIQIRIEANRKECLVRIAPALFIVDTETKSST